MTKQEITRAILQRLNITTQEYYELMYESGEDYFKWRCGGFDNILQAFRHSPKMWAWWNGQYAILDESILHNEENLTYDLYRALHIGLEHYPNDSIVENAMAEYEKVVQNEIKESLNEQFI